jgi:DnaJ-class molecular chaperone
MTQASPYLPSNPNIPQRGDKTPMSLFGLLFGTSYSNRARRDQYRPSTSIKNFISPINSYGTCFSCDGSGKKTFECKPCDGTGEFSGDCRLCDGTGTYDLPAKPCFTCQSTGLVRGSKCFRCGGTGQHKPALSLPCRKCCGTGSFTSTCNRCSGSGDFCVTCKKCGGSGWHRF